MTNRQVHPEDIIDIVGNKFNISKEESSQKLTELLQFITKDDHLKGEDKTANRITKIKTNNGFNIVFEFNKKIKDYECVIHSIDSIYYLEHIQTFLLNLVSIILNKVNKNTVNKYFGSLNGPF